ncbi:MAG: T9SS type A sorting domain-containing protein [Bacteroidia bacterium]
MKKIYIIVSILFLIFSVEKSDAQITGDTAVCAGNIYTYTANVTGAATYQWTTPAGWYNLQGQVTSTITVNCNVNDGDVCVEGFDSVGISLGSQCLTTHWGGGGQGWDVQPSTFTFCPSIWQNNFNPLQSIQISLNGTGGTCGNCGGLTNSNLAYCVYNGNTFIGYPNGIPFAFYAPGYPNTINWHVEYVDTSNGLNLPYAVIIHSGCGGSGNNSIQGTALDNLPSIVCSPYIPCIGSYLAFDCFNCFGFSAGYTIISGLALNPNPPYYAIVTSNTWNVYCEPTMSNGCPGIPTGINGTAVNCSTPIIGDSIVCPSYRYTYSHPIQSGYNGNWIVPVGWYDVTGQGTSTLSATCNTNVGNVGFVIRQNGYTIDTIYKVINFSEVQGWNVQPNVIQRCNSDSTPFTAQVTTNGTGGGGSCPIGCGNGVQHPNIIYGIYNAVWPNGTFVGVADSIDQINFPGYVTNYYVYEIDTTNGANPLQAILISGGCNVGTINNIISLDTISSTLTIISSAPSVCIDSSITIYITSGIINPQWTVAGGIILNNNISSIDVQPTSFQCTAFVSGMDSVTGCTTSGNYALTVNSCNTISFTGDSVVCAGYTYTYNATIPHGTTYTWTLPNGWYDVSGQNTSQLIATANSNSGLISVTAFDSTGYLIASTSFNVDFKFCRNKNVLPPVYKTCKTDSFAANVNVGSLGTGSCQLGCGNGIQHANIESATYDDVWPSGNFKGFVDGSLSISPVTSTGNLYVYQVDYTNGTNPANAILIEGGCGTCVFNNVIAIDTLPLSTAINATPTIACVGDTIIISDTNNFQNPNWINANNLNVLNSNSNPAYAIVTGVNPTLDFNAIDSISGCAVISNYQMNNETCFYPVASFQSNKTSFCEKQYVDFFDMTSNNPTSWQWTFTGGVPSSSTLQNPDSIYYALPGMYDVELITCNSYNCDTLLLSNYIQEYPSPPTPVITANSGVLYSTPAVGYAWYSTSNPTVILSTDSFYVLTMTGDFFVIITDSNGCNASSGVISNTGLQQLFSEDDFTITELSQSVFELNLKSKIADAVATLSDGQGKILISKNVKSQIQFDLRNYSKGIYFLKIQIGNKIYTKKLMVM